MSQSGRKGASLWDLFQDCFDEIFSSIVPGIIFVSYLVFIGIILIDEEIYNKLMGIDNMVKVVFLIALSYTIGTLFRRADINPIDQKSANYIFSRTAHHESGKCYAFGERITNVYLKKIISQTTSTIAEARDWRCIKKLKKRFEKELNPESIKIYAKKWNSNYRIAKRIEKKLKKYIKIKSPGDDAIKKIAEDLHRRLHPEAIYPYAHLRAYLEARNLNIAKYVSWDNNVNDSQTKMTINRFKVEILDKAPHLIPLISKNEAHIRFMGSLYHASRALRVLCITTAIIAMALVVLFESFHLQPQWIKEFILSIKSILSTEQCLLIFFISIAYILFAFFARHYVCKVIHYQRVRELVFLFMPLGS